MYGKSQQNPIYTLNFILTKLKYDIRLALRRFNGLQIKVTNKYIYYMESSYTQM